MNNISSGAKSESILNQNGQGIDVTKLEVGVKLIVETNNSTYEMVILGDKGEVTIKGGTRRNGETRFADPTLGQIAGSYPLHSSRLKLSYLGKQMCMEVYVEDDNSILTSPTQNIIVEGENWSYSLDWNKS